MKPAKTPIYIDFDQFFTLVGEMGAVGRDEFLSYLPIRSDEVRALTTLHHLFKTSMLLTTEMPVSEGRSVFSAWSQVSLLLATVALGRRRESATSSWATIYASDLHSHFAGLGGPFAASDIDITLDRMLTARTNLERKRVTFSAVTRDYLLRLNVVLTDLAPDVAGLGTFPTEDEAEFLFEYLLEHVMRLHGDVNTSNLPVARGVDLVSLQRAILITQIQVDYLLSHEFAHLKHAELSGSREDIEAACDWFAWQRIVREYGSIAECFLSVRWLFEILAFDRVVAECLYLEIDVDRAIDWLQSDLRSRIELNRLLKDHEPDAFMSPSESIGTALLINSRHRLADLGQDWVKDRLEVAEAVLPFLTADELNARISHAAREWFNDEGLSIAEWMRTWLKPDMS